MIIPVPIITSVHSGGHLPKEVIGYIILGCLAYAAWCGYFINKSIDEHWNGWITAFMIALPTIIIAILLII